MIVSISQYSTDGSSLTKERCSQIQKVFDLCQRMGANITSYKDIQNQATQEKIFGSSKADSLIRTVFPLLKKLGFVSYPNKGDFKASEFFTNLGKSFVLLTKALQYAESINNSLLTEKLQLAIEIIMRYGIAFMAQSKYNNHNIMLALEILRYEKEIYWNELLYILSCYQDGVSISDALISAKEYRSKNIDFEYINSNGKQIASTSYTYVKGFLTEAGIITNSTNNISKLNPSTIAFINSLPHYGKQNTLR